MRRAVVHWATGANLEIDTRVYGVPERVIDRGEILEITLNLRLWANYEDKLECKGSLFQGGKDWVYLR
jgi:hypothetical protein